MSPTREVLTERPQVPASDGYVDVRVRTGHPRERLRRPATNDLPVAAVPVEQLGRIARRMWRPRAIEPGEVLIARVVQGPWEATYSDSCRSGTDRSYFTCATPLPPTGHWGYFGNVSEQIIETDARGRASLGLPQRRYLMHEESDGTIILEPATVVTELERRFMANSALQAEIAHAKKHPEQQRPRKPRPRT